MGYRPLRQSRPFWIWPAFGVNLVDLVIAGDSLVKANDLDPQQFVAAADAYQGRNARRARRAASFVRAGVDSPMETRLRLLIVLAGLPEPEVNVIVRIAGGKWRWRFDLCYPEYKLIIEYDGRQHAYDAEQWSHDLNRREWLDQEGRRIVIVISEGIHGEPLRTLQRVRAALEERGARVPSPSSRSGRATSRSVPSLPSDTRVCDQRMSLRSAVVRHVWPCAEECSLKWGANSASFVVLCGETLSVGATARQRG
jgi:very-short-patch-repair endonuclease